MMEVVVIDNWNTGARAKLSNHHHQQTKIHFTGRIPSCRPTNSVKALKKKKLMDRQ